MPESSGSYWRWDEGESWRTAPMAWRKAASCASTDRLRLRRRNLPADRRGLDEAELPLELERLGPRLREAAEECGLVLLEVRLGGVVIAVMEDDQLAARVTLRLEPVGVDQVPCGIVGVLDDGGFERGVRHRRAFHGRLTRVPCRSDRSGARGQPPRSARRRPRPPASSRSARASRRARRTPCRPHQTFRSS